MELRVRLYSDLAWLWPMWGDVEEYGPETDRCVEFMTRFAAIEARTLLDMGCGGGKNACHFKKRFEVTGIDISENMLANARALNPECTFRLGDMRCIDLNGRFDAVFINDSVNYMTTKEDLLALFTNARRHLRDGGVMVVSPDYCKESFRQNATRISHAASATKPENLDVVFIENDYDPDPEDDTYEATIVYLIREDGKLRIEHDFHLCGLFSLDVWRRSLAEAGFEVREEGRDGGYTKDLPTFVCVGRA